MGKLLDIYLKNIQLPSGPVEESFANAQQVIDYANKKRLQGAVAKLLRESFAQYSLMSMDETDALLKKSYPEKAEEIIKSMRESLNGSLVSFLEKQYYNDVKKYRSEFLNLPPNETQNKRSDDYVVEKMKDRITQEIKDRCYYGSIMSRMLNMFPEHSREFVTASIERLTPEQEEAICKKWEIYEDIKNCPREEMMISPMREEIKKAFDSEAMKKYIEEHPQQKQEIAELLDFARLQLEEIAPAQLGMAKEQFNVLEKGSGLCFHDNEKKAQTLDGGKYHHLMAGPDQIKSLIPLRHSAVPEGRQGDVKDLYQEEIKLDQDQKEGLRLLLNKMREIQILQPGEDSGAETKVKAYALTRYLQLRGDLQKAVKSGDAASIVELSRQMKVQYQGVKEMMDISQKYLNKDPYLFPGNLDCIRNAVFPPELTTRFKDMSMINGAYQIYAMLNRRNVSIEEFLEHPVQTLLAEHRDSIREISVDHLMGNGDLGRVLEVLGDPKHHTFMFQASPKDLALNRSLEMLAYSCNDEENRNRLGVIHTAITGLETPTNLAQNCVLTVLTEGSEKEREMVLGNLLLADDAYRKGNLRRLLSPVGVQADGSQAGGFDQENYLDTEKTIDYREMENRYNTMLRTAREKGIPTEVEVFRAGLHAFEKVLVHRLDKNDPGRERFRGFVTGMQLPRKCDQKTRNSLAKEQKELLDRYEKLVREQDKDLAIPIQGQVSVEKMEMDSKAMLQISQASIRLMRLLGNSRMENYFINLEKGIDFYDEIGWAGPNPYASGLVIEDIRPIEDDKIKEKLARGMEVLKFVTGQYLAKHPDLMQEDPLRYEMTVTMNRAATTILKGESLVKLFSVNPLMLEGFIMPMASVNFSPEIKGKQTQNVHFFQAMVEGTRLQELLDNAQGIPAGDRKLEEETREKLLGSIRKIRQEAIDCAESIADKNSSEYQNINSIVTPEYKDKVIGNADIVGHRGMLEVNAKMARVERLLEMNWPVQLLPFQMFLDRLTELMSNAEKGMDFGKARPKAFGELKELLGTMDTAFADPESSNLFMGKLQVLMEKDLDFYGWNDLRDHYHSQIGEVRAYMAERNLDLAMDGGEDMRRVIQEAGALFENSNRWYYWNSGQYYHLRDDIREYAALQNRTIVRGTDSEIERKCLKNMANHAESYIRKVIAEGKGISPNKAARTLAAITLLHRINPIAAKSLVEGNAELMKELVPPDRKMEGQEPSRDLMESILEEERFKTKEMSLQEEFGQRLSQVTKEITSFEESVKMYLVDHNDTRIANWESTPPVIEKVVNETVVGGWVITAEECCSLLRAVWMVPGSVEKMGDLLGSGDTVKGEKIAEILGPGLSEYAKTLSGGYDLLTHENQVEAKVVAIALQFAESVPDVLDNINEKLGPEERDQIRAVGEMVKLREKSDVAEKNLMEAARDGRELKAEEKREILQNMLNYELVKNMVAGHTGPGLPDMVMALKNGTKDAEKVFAEAGSGKLLEELSKKSVSELAGIKRESISRRLAHDTVMEAARRKGKEALEASREKTQKLMSQVEKNKVVEQEQKNLNKVEAGPIQGS